VDYTIGQILVDILGAKVLPAVAMYSAIANQAAQIAAVKEAARVELPPEQHKYFDALMTIYHAEAKQRHKFAHWIWVHCEQASEFLILVEPIRLIQSDAAISHMRQQQGKIAVTTYSELKFKPVFGEDCYCYSKEELKRIVKQFTEVLTLFRAFQAIVGRQSPRIKAQAFEYLTQHTQILVVLSRKSQDHQSSTSGPEYNI
jgi:hypothetical protein